MISHGGPVPKPEGKPKRKRVKPSDWDPWALDNWTPEPGSRQERRIKLKKAVAERAGGMCEVPGCGRPGVHLAHLRGSGMGGDPTGARDTERNTILACMTCHDVLDGRSTEFRLRMLENVLLEIVRLRYG